MKALIIGAAGFVGPYLADHLQRDCGWSVTATKMSYEKIDFLNAGVYDLDIMDRDSIEVILRQIKPDYIFHLAAQSSVALSWNKPALTIDVNIKGAINVLDAVRVLDYKPRILLIGSGEEYGYVFEDEVPVNEKNHLRPGNIYSATKACQNMIGKIYSNAYDMNIVMVRAFNHIGPGQSPAFVVSDFCKQVAEIEADKREPVIYVGNLSAKRDFTDVRDVVRAYSLLIKAGDTGETYNVGSGQAIKIEDILKIILSMSAVDIKAVADKSKFRPVDVPVIEADINKLQSLTNWAAQIKIEHTIAETLQFWRNKIAGVK